MSFTNINIDRSRIESTIKKYATIQSVNDAKNKVYSLNDSGKQFKITVYLKEKGLTTLLPQGKDIEEGKKLCKKIQEELKYFDISALNGSIEVDKDNFDLFIKKIEEVFSSEITKSNISGGILYKLEKSKEGKLNLSYYNRSKKLLIQGKAGKYLKLILSELTKLEYNTLQLVSSMQEVTIPEEEDVLKEYLPSIENKLPIKVKSIAASSLQLLKINGSFSDYAFMTSPIFRTLEHIMRKILDEGNYEFSETGAFIMFSRRNDKYHLKSNNNGKLNDECKTKLELCYTYYHENRNGLSHLYEDDIDNTVIESKEMAEHIIEKCIEHIEDFSNDY